MLWGQGETARWRKYRWKLLKYSPNRQDLAPFLVRSTKQVPNPVNKTQNNMKSMHSKPKIWTLMNCSAPCLQKAVFPSLRRLQKWQKRQQTTVDSTSKWCSGFYAQKGKSMIRAWEWPRHKSQKWRLCPKSLRMSATYVSVGKLGPGSGSWIRVCFKRFLCYDFTELF